MRSSVRRLSLALAAVAFAAPAAAGKVIAPAPVADRVARADAVVVGKVTAIDPKPVQFQGSEYAIAVV